MIIMLKKPQIVLLNGNFIKYSFDNDELSRYVVRISINPNDVGRLVIND